jgi:hypothetical protein
MAGHCPVLRPSALPAYLRWERAMSCRSCGPPGATAMACTSGHDRGHGIEGLAALIRYLNSIASNLASAPQGARPHAGT